MHLYFKNYCNIFNIKYYCKLYTGVLDVFNNLLNGNNIILCLLFIIVLSRALNTMCRIGEDLYIEPNATQLVMHTTNNWHTMYAWFTFDSSFFSSYYFTKDDEQNSENSLKCKISLKVLYFYFIFSNLTLLI